MSYRIYVNHKQVLGNNECPYILINELERQGCKFDSDKCFHDFEITDLQGIIEALEKYIYGMEEWTKEHYNGKSIADFREELEEWKSNFTYKLTYSIDCGYLFVTYNFLKYIKDDYEQDFDFEKKRMVYTIKEGHHVYMSGF